MKQVLAVWGLVCLATLVLATGVTSGQSTGAIVGWGSMVVVGPSALEDLVEIAGCGYYSLGLKSDGTVVAWGSNNEGQCSVPAPNSDFVAVAAGGGHSLGLKSDGTIIAWGNNDYGQCDVPAPNADFVAVAGGCFHSLGLKSDGTIVAWGLNDEGQCDVPAPNAGFVAVAGGRAHSLGLKSDGTIVAWGSNGCGQCDVPAPNADFAAVAGGWWHSLGVSSSDTPVETAFYATLVHEDRAVLLRWSLPSCSGDVGLRIYRAPSLDGPYSCVTPEPLPANELGSYVDETAWPGGTFWYELRALLASGEETLATDIRPSVTVPGTLAAGIRYVMPNPATTGASIGYSLPAGWRSARLAVHDVAGRLVRRLDPATGAQGFHAVDWDGTASSGDRVASGVYFVRLEVDGAVATQRMVLLR